MSESAVALPPESLLGTLLEGAEPELAVVGCACGSPFSLDEHAAPPKPAMIRAATTPLRRTSNCSAPRVRSNESRLAHLSGFLSFGVLARRAEQCFSQRHQGLFEEIQLWNNALRPIS